MIAMPKPIDRLKLTALLRRTPLALPMYRCTCLSQRPIGTAKTLRCAAKGDRYRRIEIRASC
jgi:hypothetical protein